VVLFVGVLRIMSDIFMLYDAGKTRERRVFSVPYVTVSLGHPHGEINNFQGAM
jgi:hypothetical protein